MRSFTVAELIVKCQNRGNYARSQKLTDTIWMDFLDAGLTEIWDLLASKFEDYYTERDTSTSTAAGTESYSLPDDFYKLLGVDVKVGGNWRACERFGLYERNDFEGGVGPAYFNGAPFRYRHEGSSLLLQPTPQSVKELRIIYVKSAPKLTLTSQSLDFVNGWEKLPVLLAVREAKVMFGESVTEIDREIERQTGRVTVAADGRDAGEPGQVQDVAALGGGPWR